MAPAPADKQTATEPDSGECHFFRLPAELRNEIYTLAIETSRPRYAYDLGHLPIRPALVAVNRQVRAESMPIYFTYVLKTFDTSMTVMLQAADECADAEDQQLVQPEEYKAKYKAFIKTQNTAVRASACYRTESKRLHKMGWPVAEWIDGEARAMGLVEEEDGSP